MHYWLTPTLHVGQGIKQMHIVYFHPLEIQISADQKNEPDIKRDDVSTPDSLKGKVANSCKSKLTQIK